MMRQPWKTGGMDLSDETKRDEAPVECDCCKFEGASLDIYDEYGEETSWLCGLCASTLAGRLRDYAALSTICYVGNAILAAIKGEKP